MRKNEDEWDGKTIVRKKNGMWQRMSANEKTRWMSGRIRTTRQSERE